MFTKLQGNPFKIKALSITGEGKRRKGDALQSTNHLTPTVFCPDFIVGTVHKAKGLEFESVMITDDFVRVPWPRHRMYRSPAFSLGGCSSPPTA